MSTIQFENGTKVNFEGTPTPQDVEEVALKLNIKKPEEKPGVVRGLAQSIAKPFEKTIGGVLNLLPGEDKAQRKGIFGGTVDTLGYKDGERLHGKELAKDVVGTGLELSSYAIPGGAVGKGLSTLGKVKTGLKLGGLTGASSGFGQALQEQKTLGEATGEGIKTGILGGGLGGIGSGIISSKLPKTVEEIAKNKTKHFDNVAQGIASKITPTSAESLTTKKSGGLFGLNQHDIIDYSQDPKMVKAYEAVKDIYLPKETAGANKNIIKQHIEKIAEKEVKPFLAKNKVPFNFQDLRDSFDNVSIPSSLKRSQTALSTYNDIKEDLLSTLAKTLRKNTANPLKPTDMNELWEARKLIDKKIENELQFSLGDEHLAGAKAIAQDFRRQLSEFIDESLKYPGQMDKINKAKSVARELSNRGQPIDNIEALYKQFGVTSNKKDKLRMKKFRNAMEKMSSMYYATDGLSTKIKGDLGKSSIGRVMENLQKNKLTSGVLGAIGGGAIVNALGD